MFNASKGPLPIQQVVFHRLQQTPSKNINWFMFYLIQTGFKRYSFQKVRILIVTSQTT